jgi:hypothetical protein
MMFYFKNQRSLQKIQKPAAALVEVKICPFSSTFLKSVSWDSLFKAGYTSHSRVFFLPNRENVAENYAHGMYFFTMRLSIALHAIVNSVRSERLGNALEWLQ